MIDSLKRPPGSLRWAPRQRFALNDGGRTAKVGYELAVSVARGHEGGRDRLEAAQAAWASPLGLEPGDGLFLDEFARGKMTVAQVAEALADCGITRPEAQAATDRLYKAGLLEPDPQPTSEHAIS